MKTEMKSSALPGNRRVQTVTATPSGAPGDMTRYERGIVVTQEVEHVGH